MSNEKPLHQKSAQGKIPGCQKHYVEHLSCTVLCTFSKIQIYSVIFFRDQSQAHSALGTFLAASPSCPELHTRAWSLPGVGGTLARPRRRLLRRRDLPWRLTGDKNGGSTPLRTAHRPSALRVASCVPAHARGTATVAGKHGTRSLPPTGPRRPVLSNSPPKHQTPARLAPKRNRGPPR